MEMFRNMILKNKLNHNKSKFTFFSLLKLQIVLEKIQDEWKVLKFYSDV